MNAPITHSYNLGRLGNAGDMVRFEADTGERAALASLSGVLSVERFAVTVDLKKTGPNRYVLDYRLEADVTQACVVTLEPLAAAIDRRFTREWHVTGVARRPGSPEGTLDLSGDLSESGPDAEAPEEIESPHVDLAAPALEEYLLALDPYPRRPGVEFDPGQAAGPARESPFTVLKSLTPKP